MPPADTRELESCPERMFQGSELSQFRVSGWFRGTTISQPACRILANLLYRSSQVAVARGGLLFDQYSALIRSPASPNNPLTLIANIQKSQYIDYITHDHRTHPLAWPKRIDYLLPPTTGISPTYISAFLQRSGGKRLLTSQNWKLGDTYHALRLHLFAPTHHLGNVRRCPCAHTYTCASQN